MGLISELPLKFILFKYLLVSDLFTFWGREHLGVYPSGVIYPILYFWTGVPFYSRFTLLLSLFYTDHLVFIILFNDDYLNSVTILLCLCFYSRYYCFINLNCICSNNNLYMRLSFHFTYDTDEEIVDFETFVNNFKLCDIDVALPSHLQMIFWPQQLWNLKLLKSMSWNFHSTWFAVGFNYLFGLNFFLVFWDAVFCRHLIIKHILTKLLFWGFGGEKLPKFAWNEVKVLWGMKAWY